MKPYARWTLLACLIAPASADTVSINPSADNTLVQIADGSLSNGGDTGLFAGRTAQGVDSIRRGLLRFDVAAVVPAGATVTSASLTLYMSKTRSATFPIALHRAARNWGEGSASGSGIGAPAQPGDATWLHSEFDTVFWNTPGGDFEPQSSASLAVGGGGYYTWTTNAALVADAQFWLDQPDQAFGWMLIGDETVQPTSKRFESRESPFPEQRPVLTLEFELPCAGDVDGDNDVDLSDLGALLAGFGTQAGATREQGDLNGDGAVDLSDLGELLSQFGSSC